MSTSLVLKSLIAATAATAALAFAAAAPAASPRSAHASSPAVICTEDTHWSPQSQACVAN